MGACRGVVNGYIEFSMRHSRKMVVSFSGSSCEVVSKENSHLTEAGWEHINLWESLECSLDFLDCVCLDDISNLDVVVALDVETAVHTHVNFLDIVLESLE